MRRLQGRMHALQGVSPSQNMTSLLLLPWERTQLQFFFFFLHLPTGTPKAPCGWVAQLQCPLPSTEGSPQGLERQAGHSHL